MKFPPCLRAFEKSVAKRRLSLGFSLVEMVLGIGIVGFSLPVILSLLPLGNANLQDATRQMIQSEIFDTVRSELTATSFSDLDSYCGNSGTSARFPIYFDAEGVETAKANAVFTAQCVLTGTGELRQAMVRIGFHQDPGTTDIPTVKAEKQTFVLSNRGS
jgi:uncharacterized protein (TIGR02598 family)